MRAVNFLDSSEVVYKPAGQMSLFLFSGTSKTIKLCSLSVHTIQYKIAVYSTVCLTLSYMFFVALC